MGLGLGIGLGLGVGLGFGLGLTLTLPLPLPLALTLTLTCPLALRIAILIEFFLTISLLSPGTISLSRLSLNSRWFLPLKSRIFRSNLGVSVGVRVRVKG